VKKVIEDQINGDIQLRHSGSGATSPFLSWGIYMWSDGITPQQTNPNVSWNCNTDFKSDGVHPSDPVGTTKVATLLLDFYQNDALSCPWFFNNRPTWCSSTTGKTDERIENNTVTVSPHPFTSASAVHFTPSTSATIRVSSLYGRLVESVTIDGSSGVYALGGLQNLAASASGIYVITIVSGTTTKTTLIVK